MISQKAKPLKAIRTKAAKSPNPLFSHTERKAARQRGEVYETSEFLTHDIGDLMDCPDCWKIVIRGGALPYDAECAKKVLSFLGSSGRSQITDDIKLLRQASAKGNLSDKDKKYLSHLEKAYAVELGLVETHVDLLKQSEALAANDSAGIREEY